MKLGIEPTTSSIPNFLKNTFNCSGLFIFKLSFAHLNKVNKLTNAGNPIYCFSASFLNLPRAELFAYKEKLTLKPRKMLFIKD